MYLTIGIVGSLSNLFHKWSHMRDDELSIMYLILQKLYLVSGHAHHSVHHEDTPDQKYAVVFPITNVILDNIFVFRILEGIIKIITGIDPDRKKSYSTYQKEGLHTYVHHANAGKAAPPIITFEEQEMLHRNLDAYYKCKTKEI